MASPVQRPPAARGVSAHRVGSRSRPIAAGPEAMGRSLVQGRRTDRPVHAPVRKRTPRRDGLRGMPKAGEVRGPDCQRRHPSARSRHHDRLKSDHRRRAVIGRRPASDQEVVATTLCRRGAPGSDNDMTQAHCDALGVWQTESVSFLGGSSMVADLAATGITLMRTGLEHVEAFTKLSSGTSRRQRSMLKALWQRKIQRTRAIQRRTPSRAASSGACKLNRERLNLYCQRRRCSTARLSVVMGCSHRRTMSRHVTKQPALPRTCANLCVTVWHGRWRGLEGNDTNLRQIADDIV